MSDQPLLSVDRLNVSARRPDGTLLPILTDISLQVARGQTLGIVGESGSGKTILSLAIMGLLPDNLRADGSVSFADRNLLSLSDEALCSIRGRRIGMIFQEPMTALNPAMSIGDQIAEGLVWHHGTPWSDAVHQAERLLDRVRIPDAARRAKAYPHELSGGQRQRVGIAMALALKPEMIIADEPTTALDVTVQAEVLDILAELVRENRMALIIVSHNLGVIARATERILILYAGTRMEEGETPQVLSDPRNPYTRGLLDAIPMRRPGGTRLQAIPGTVPSLAHLPPGCRFSGRCRDEIAACALAEPDWRTFADGRGVRCIRADIAAGSLS